MLKRLKHHLQKRRKTKPTTSEPADMGLANVYERMEHANFDWHDKQAEEAGEHENKQEGKKQSEKMAQSLRSIYVDERTGKLPSMDRLEHHRSWKWVIWVFGGTSLACVISAIAWVGFLSLPAASELQTGEVRLQIQGQSDVTIGQESDFIVNYENDDVVAVRQVHLRVNVPPDFVILSREPELTNHDLSEWEWAELSPGQKGSIHIRGYAIGTLGSNTQLQAILTYKKSVGDALQEKILSQPIHYAQSVLTATTSLPPKFIAGDTINMQIKLANVGHQALTALWARPIVPAGFTFSTTTLLLSNGLINIGAINPQASTTVTLAGRIPDQFVGDANFGLDIGRTTASGTFQMIQTVSQKTPVVAGDFLLHLVVNGSDHASSTIQPGDMIRATVGYQNTSPELMKNVSVKLLFESVVDGRSTTGTSLLDWTKLEDTKKGATSTKPKIQTLSYDKTNFPDLAELPTQGDGSIEIALPTKLVATGTKDARVRVSAVAVIPELGGSKLNRTITLTPIELIYKTDADLSVEARYFTEEGAPLGFGPIPPVSGKTTAYRIFWNLQKTFHSLKNISVSASLPKNAAWSAKTHVDAGTLSYNTSTRTVTWTLNAMPASLNQMQAWFEVDLTPDDFDIGRFADLVYDAQASWQDGDLNEALTQAKPRLTTDLPNDDGLKGKGVVRKAMP